MHTPEPTGTPRPLPFLEGLLPTWLHVSDIQGLAQLATQATLGITGLAETVQGNVYKAVAAPFGPLGAKFIDRLPGASGVRRSGITGLVYGSIKGVTRLAGGTANALLSRAAPLAGAAGFDTAARGHAVGPERRAGRPLRRRPTRWRFP
jgi:hypothetical protein